MGETRGAVVHCEQLNRFRKMKKILFALAGMGWFLLLMFAAFSGFANPWFFIPSFIIAAVAMAHGKAIEEWIFKGLE